MADWRSASQWRSGPTVGAEQLADRRRTITFLTTRLAEEVIRLAPGYLGDPELTALAQPRAFPAARPPTAAIPNRVVVVDRLPLNGNIKIDRRLVMNLASASNPRRDGTRENGTRHER